MAVQVGRLLGGARASRSIEMRLVSKIGILLEIGLAYVMISNAASAADAEPRWSYRTPAPVIRSYNWTGCYLGGFLGGAFAQGNVSVTDLQGYNSVGDTWTYKLDNSF
jgi:hypothetical protein